MRKCVVLVILVLSVLCLNGCTKDEKPDDSKAQINITPEPALNESWVCLACGKDSTGTFCSWCGTRKSDSIKCPNCGAEYSADSKYEYCNKCGAALMNIEETGNPTPAPSSEAEEGWKVTALDWERSIQIEEYREFEENGWSLPTGAELVSEREEIRTYRQEMVGSHSEYYEEQVYDHDEIVGYNQVDQGNGTVKLVPIIEPMYRTETRSREVPDYISVPVMDTKYYYKTRRWTLTRTVTASGNDHNPFWPDLNLADNEREAEKDSRCEIYRVEVKNTKNPDIVRIYCLSESDWLSVQTGDLLDLSLESLEE